MQAIHYPWAKLLNLDDLKATHSLAQGDAHKKAATKHKMTVINV